MMRDTSDAARNAQLEAYRRMDGATRLAIACQMSDEARALAEAGQRQRLHHGAGMAQANSSAPPSERS
jgi:hypothetical protein